jgi:hypothetical protein
VGLEDIEDGGAVGEGGGADLFFAGTAEGPGGLLEGKVELVDLGGGEVMGV